MEQMNKNKKKLRRGGIILFWLLVWQVAAIRTNNVILLAGPWEVGRAFCQNILYPDFWQIVWNSLSRIGLGFALGFVLAVLLGALGYRCSLLEEFLSPPLTVIKSVPVASFVVLLLIWFGSSKLSFFISFLIVFPNIYINTLAGLHSTDAKLLEMAEVFEIKRLQKFLYIYRSALMPYLYSGMKISLGMSWKAGVAAEVIGISNASLGERIYLSKIYLDTAGLLAWTLTVIFISFLFEKAVFCLAERFAAWKPAGLLYRTDGKKALAQKAGNECPGRHEESRPSCEGWMEIQNIRKAYDKKPVFSDFSMKLEKGKRYCLMAPSGTGKTTLLRLLNHLEKADGGRMPGVPLHSAMVFQEDRLCEEYSALDNIMLTAKGDRETIRRQACKILPDDCLDKPVRELSGGMKRRVAILRAMLADFELVLLDEPFAGLDEENRKKTGACILELLSGRTLLAATHGAGDMQLLDAELIELTGHENCENYLQKC